MKPVPGMKPSLLAAILAAFAINAAFADALPSFAMFTSYLTARNSLLRQGWLPWRLPNATSCSPQDDRCRGRPEMLRCDAGGSATCVFTWKKRQQRYRSHYAGERVQPRCHRGAMPIWLRFTLALLLNGLEKLRIKGPGAAAPHAHSRSWNPASAAASAMRRERRWCRLAPVGLIDRSSGSGQS
jgi:hypothetical protein